MYPTSDTACSLFKECSPYKQLQHAYFPSQQAEQVFQGKTL
ncbi:hypothetical protein [Mucilaginibacter sp.]|nr:hypothetical protein [Mucilaginibacter sp.]